jgi:hypothetical protein
MRDLQSAGQLKLGSPLEQIAIEPGFPISRINLRKSAKSADKKPCFVRAPARPRAGVYLSLATFRLLLQTLQFAREAGLRRRVHPVDEKNAVEVIDLVLERSCQ